MRLPKAKLFWPLASILVLSDCSTKQLAVEHLSEPHVPYEVFGDLFRLTLAYNPGAAMSLSFGPHSRIILSTLTMIALLAMLYLYRRTRAEDLWQALGLALIFGGALGNLLDRLRSPRGVVDFIDVGLGTYRFWIFNVADVGITLGALLLAAILWRREGTRQLISDRAPAAPTRHY